MKLSKVLSSHTDHEMEIDVRGDTITVGWHQPDHVEMVKGSKAASAMSAASSVGLLKRGAWLEELPQHVALPKKLHQDLNDLVLEHYDEESERETIFPATPDSLKPYLQRYRAKVSEPKISVSGESYLELCQVICGWITHVTPLTDENDEQLDWANLSTDQRLSVVRAFPQESVMTILTDSFDQDSLSEDVKND